MNISISTPVYDVYGQVYIQPIPNTDESETRRRVARVATLDGGVAVNDRGFAEGDRDLEYTFVAQSRAHNDSIDRLVKLYARVHVSTPGGVYLAAPESFTPGQNESTIKLLVISKLSE